MRAFDWHHNQWRRTVTIDARYHCGSCLLNQWTDGASMISFDKLDQIFTTQGGNWQLALQCIATICRSSWQSFLARGRVCGPILHTRRMFRNVVDGACWRPFSPYVRPSVLSSVCRTGIATPKRFRISKVVSHRMIVLSEVLDAKFHSRNFRGSPRKNALEAPAVESYNLTNAWR